MKNISRACIFAGLFFLLSPQIFAQEIREALSPFMQSWSKRHNVNANHLAFVLIDVASGNVVDSHQAQKPQPLASVSKIFTTKYVLDQLGSDARFETNLLARGRMVDTTLKGDLALAGDGDPMLFLPDLSFLCEQMASKGLTKIEGDFYYDDQYPFQKQEISMMGLGDESYNCAISGLNINFNRIEFYNQGGKWISLPPLASMQVSSAPGPFAYGVRFLYDPVPSDTEHWTFMQKGRYAKREELPMKRPGLHAAHLLRDQCRQFGIELPVPKQWTASPYYRFVGEKVATHQSLPLQEIQRLALEYSNNIMAESALLKTHATVKRGQTTLREASEHMVGWLRSRYRELDWSSVTLVNGSGLSSENKSSPLILAQMLRESDNGPKSSRGIKTLLPLVGHSGWISERFKHPDITHRMWAKTGSLDYVVNLAGYLVGKDAKTYAFALMYTDAEKRSYLDQFNDEKAHMLRQSAPGDRRRLAPRIDEILIHWLQKY